MTTLRHDWNRAELRALFDLPFNDFLFQAQTIHRQHFDPNAVQVSTLLSIKTEGFATKKTVNTVRSQIILRYRFKIKKNY